ncbi:DUF6351 family protein [Pendulispora brunnea]|uniref:DUF6351 family protein n=1 Tax=Pendulispora brunnea TaxID=2905690 RepID=A0ABZ2K9T9_9BACT
MRGDRTVLRAGAVAMLLCACGGGDAEHTGGDGWSPDRGPVSGGSSSEGKPSVGLVVLSNRPDLLSAHDALVEIVLPRGASEPDIATLRVDVDGRDVTAAFERRKNGRVMGLVTGLALGRNVLSASLAGGVPHRVELVNHPNGGPVFAGPQVQPWACQSTAVDEACNQPVAYSFFYRSTNPNKDWQPYDAEHPPSDLAMTTTDAGVTVPFIVRVETGYQDRDQYTIGVLFQPGSPWTPWEPQTQWNRKLLITHGGSCGVSYAAGSAPSIFYDGAAGNITGLPIIDNQIANSPTVALGRGFAVMSTALDNNGHNCNLLTQAESLVMAKEHLVETYGELRYTIGTGCSGGSLSQQWIANAYPGIYQGILPQCSFPDTWTSTTQVADYHLLRAYFENPLKWKFGILWTPLQWGSVTGHPNYLNVQLADNAFFSAAVATYACSGTTAENRYDPLTNPGGVRCGIADHAMNLFGPRPADVWTAAEKTVGRGFAGLALDNVGVQYGLAALQSWAITPAQFIDLNAKIGGVDIDGQVVSKRTVADPQALARAYRSGAINEANNLGQVAIIDLRGPDPGFAHDAYRTWAIRARLDRAQGHHKNHVVWFGQVPVFGGLNYPREGLIAMDRWLSAVEADGRDAPLAQKIVEDKPADIGDYGAGYFYGTPRTVAGEAITTDINKCQLKPLSRNDDYGPGFSDSQWSELQAIFPDGVCDYAKSGVAQDSTIPWLTYQDSSGHVVYGGQPMPMNRQAGGWASAAFSPKEH